MTTTTTTITLMARLVPLLSVLVLSLADAHATRHLRATPDTLSKVLDEARRVNSRKPNQTPMLQHHLHHHHTTVIHLAPGVYPPGLHLHAGDSNIHLRAERPDLPPLVSGGIAISGWAPIAANAPGAGSFFRAAVPPMLAALGLPIRNLWLNGTRLQRPELDSQAVDSLGLLRTETGFLSTSGEPLSWTEPETVELIGDETFTCHRCTLASIAPLPTRPSAPPAPCQFSTPVHGTSPGPSIEQTRASSLDECETLCCHTLRCQAVIFRSNGSSCYLLPRTYNGSFVPGPDAVVSNRLGQPPTQARANLTVQQPCLRQASSARFTRPTRIQNAWAGVNATLAASPPGTFYHSVAENCIYLHAPSGVDPNAAVLVAGLNQTLLHLNASSNMAFINITFAYTQWPQVNTPAGFVERYGGVYYPNDGSGVGMRASPAAVQVEHSRDIVFDQCVFQHLGQFGLHFANSTQDSAALGCLFTDLSGGSAYLGSLHDSNETNPARQVARLRFDNNRVINVGAEYPGSPGVHSFCTVDSSISHNLVRHVPYTGISFNWPMPQTIGYSRNNSVHANAVSDFMYWGRDGGGIHVIGPTGNSSISANVFGNCSDQDVQSIIYIDNFSNGNRISDNIVQNCPAVPWIFFQRPSIGAAFNNYVRDCFVQNAAKPNGEPCNCTDISYLAPGQPLPPAAQAIAQQAGPQQ